MSETKNAVKSINSKTDHAEERIRETEDRKLEMAQIEDREARRLNEAIL